MDTSFLGAQCLIFCWTGSTAR